MENLIAMALFGIACIFALIVIGRFVGAWMLRINEVIDNLKEAVSGLRALNENTVEVHEELKAIKKQLNK